MSVFFPDVIVDSYRNIDLDMLKKKKIKGLIFDIDNTLVSSKTVEADDNLVEWLNKVRQKGFKACIVSNASKKRVEKFNRKLKLFAVHRATKPFPQALKKACKNMGTDYSETALVGDQIFTDVWGGNLLNMFTILVRPIQKEENLFVRLKRHLEILVLKKYKERGGNSGNF